MNNKASLFIALFLAAFFVSTPAQANNASFSIDLFALDAQNSPLNGETDVTYCLSKNADERDCLVEETQQAVFEDGVYKATIDLNGVSPTDLGEEAFLLISIANEDLDAVELSTVPWAMSSQLATRALQADVATTALSIQRQSLGSGLTNAGGLITLDPTIVPRLSTANT